MFQKVKEIITLGGDIIREGFGNPKHIKEKLGEVDLVTEYDTRVEDYLRERFQEEFPEFQFIGEEAGDLEDYVNDKELKNYFIVDPIDGTSNFIQGFPYVSISVAIYKDNKPYYGVVYNPITKELYEAEAGSGQAFCNKEVITTSDQSPKELIGGLYVSKRKLNPPRSEVEVIEKLKEDYQDTRKIHSAALEMCYVAKGVYGVYAVNRISPWDVAAGMMILKEAGGSSTDLYGEELDVLNITNILAVSSK